MNAATKLSSAAKYAVGGTTLVGAWCLLSEQASPPLCQPSKVVPFAPEPSHAVLLATLKRCLEKKGVYLSAADIKDSPTDLGRFGIYANQETLCRTSPGLYTRFKTLLRLSPGDSVLARFPLEASISAKTILATDTAPPSQQQNQTELALKEMLNQGAIDERTAVVMYLLVERLKRQSSDFWAWFRLLPTTFETPLYWTDSDLAWIKGTSLHKATVLRKKALERQWQQIEPLCRRLTLQSGIESTPSYKDFLWASSIFWSRALAVPSADGKDTEESIIPGLDFCNHSSTSICRWRVTTLTTKRGDKSSTTKQSAVELVCPGNAWIKPGAELTFNYGNKSNEDLLFHYGFTLDNNPDEVLMVLCPIPPPSEWDEELGARMELLLNVKNLRPQLFLGLEHLEKAVARGDTPSKRSNNKSSSGSVYIDGLPQEVVDVLSVFVMEPRDVLRQLESSSSGLASSSGKQKKTETKRDALIHQVEESGLRMAILTTLVRLLEMRVAELESNSEGTGSLERDEALLAAADKNLSASVSSAHQQQQLSKVQRNGLVYRIGQKRLARAYLMHVSNLLQREMKVLSRLQEQLGDD